MKFSLKLCDKTIMLPFYLLLLHNEWFSVHLFATYNCRHIILLSNRNSVLVIHRFTNIIKAPWLWPLTFNIIFKCWCRTWMESRCCNYCFFIQVPPLFIFPFSLNISFLLSVKHTHTHTLWRLQRGKAVWRSGPSIDQSRRLLWRLLGQTGAQRSCFQ